MKLYVTKKSAGIQYIIEENNAPVCRMATQSKVPAAHIVHCVNNHDALVDALYNLASACSELIELGDFLEDGPMAHMINNALKLAKESKL